MNRQKKKSVKAYKIKKQYQSELIDIIDPYTKSLWYLVVILFSSMYIIFTKIDNMPDCATDFIKVDF